MRGMINTAAAFSLALGLTFSAANIAFAGSETTVEQKTTTTSPSGRFVVENETKRTFKLEGHTETYTAPADADFNSYTGKEVSVQVDDTGNVTKIERKTTVTE